MSLLIALVIVVLLPLTIIWWIDVTVEDEFYDNFKPKPDSVAVKPRYGEAVNSTVARLAQDASYRHNIAD